jgi:HK97 family phage prohead protease
MNEEMRKSLLAAFKSFEETGEAQKFLGSAEVKVMPRVDEGANAPEPDIIVTLSAEIMDRDGEVVDIDGLDLSNYKKNPVLLDAHNMYGSVIDTVLGRLENLKKVTEDGIKKCKATLVFANTPRAQLAKMLVMDGYVKTVSIGFGVKGYDPDGNRITKSELYETSLVSVPANVGAMIGKSLKGMEDNEIVKKLRNYAEIHPKIKEYRRLFLGSEMLEKLGYTKGEDELIDIKSIYDLLLTKLEAPVEIEEKEEETPNPEPEEKAPQYTQEEIDTMVAKAVIDQLTK